MNPKLQQYIERYTALEIEVQTLVTGLCNSLCSQCTQICCRADICEEAIESPFLRFLNKRTELDSDAYGFLTPTGCGIQIGRPTVCYEYFCADHIYHQPEEIHAKVMKILGALPAHATRDALNGSPLSEILQEEALERVDFKTLEDHLDESFCALEVIKSFYNEGTLPDHSEKILDRITFSEEDYPIEGS
jgi:hypothetical protein